MSMMIYNRDPCRNSIKSNTLNTNRISRIVIKDCKQSFSVDCLSDM